MAESPADTFILLVEDDLDVRESLADVLRDTGRTVLEARDGVEALSKLEKLPKPCLILLDLMMPRMDGHEFMGHLRDRYSPAEFRVLVISARRDRGCSGVPGSSRNSTEAFRLAPAPFVGRGVLLNSLHD